ncbi:hypothetical protein S40288_01510 [Stachybotrys chartarum IBT 40288]|nr:hypothetical protein S40288_01510 [Stachybotrys chartarum IBT 40288]
MPRRKRRTSTSSVETVDENQIRWLKERSVVKTASSAISTDEWPIFELRDAVVLNKDGRTLENALEVGTRGPYIVRGHLIIDDRSQETNLIRRVRSSTPIEIDACVSYAIGESGDDHPRPLIWVSGRGGWYEIEPAPEYCQIYNKMCEATTMYYIMIDIYNSGGRRKTAKKSKKADWMEELAPILHQYATRVGDGATLEEAKQRCIDHAPFFLFQFVQESPDLIDWKSTGLYKWLTSEHDDIFKKAQNPPKVDVSPSSSNTTPSNPGDSTSPRSQRSTSRDSDDIQSNTRHRRAKPVRTMGPSRISQEILQPAMPSPATPRPITPQPVNLSPGEEENSAFESVFNAIEAAYETRKSAKSGLTCSSALNYLYFAYKFPNFRNGTTACHKIPVEEVLRYNAKALVGRLDPLKYHNHEFYEWLQKEATEPTQTPFVAMKPTDFPFHFIPRGSRPPPKSKPGLEPQQSADNSPRPLVKDGSRNPTIGKRVPGRGPGVKSSLRLGSTKKRPYAAIESDDQEEEEDVKRSHFFTDDETVQFAAESSLEDNADTKEDEISDGEITKILIKAEKLPSTIPRGPDGTWTCEQGDCDYIVRGGDEAACQARIRDHFREHEQTRRVHLAMSESRGLLPIKYVYFPPVLLLVQLDDDPVIHVPSAPIAANPDQHEEPKSPVAELEVPEQAVPCRAVVDDFRRALAPHLLDKIKNIKEQTQQGVPLPQHIKRKVLV